MTKFLSFFSITKGLLAIVFGLLLLFGGFFAGYVFSNKKGGHHRGWHEHDGKRCKHCFKRQGKWRDKAGGKRGEGYDKFGTRGYDIGDEASDFSLKSTDGNMVSLASMEGSKGFIVVFTCNTCPYSQAYESRLIALDEKYRTQGYPLVAINANDPREKPGDSYEEMQARAREYGYTFPYLFDETQEVAKAYGARKTPHVFVLRREAEKNIVAYIGGIDDNYKDAEKAQKKFVEAAVDALLQGKEVVIPKTRAIGCGIKWRRS